MESSGRGSQVYAAAGNPSLALSHCNLRMAGPAVSGEIGIYGQDRLRRELFGALFRHAPGLEALRRHLRGQFGICGRLSLS